MSLNVTGQVNMETLGAPGTVSRGVYDDPRRIQRISWPVQSSENGVLEALVILFFFNIYNTFAYALRQLVIRRRI